MSNHNFGVMIELIVLDKGCDIFDSTSKRRLSTALFDGLFWTSYARHHRRHIYGAYRKRFSLDHRSHDATFV